MWLWCKLASLVKAINVLQNADTSTCWSLQSKVGGRVRVDKVIVEILEVEVHRFVQRLGERGSPGRRPVSKLFDVKAVQETAEAIQMAPSAWCKAKIGRGEILFKELAQRSSDLAEVDVYFEEGTRDESLSKS